MRTGTEPKRWSDFDDDDDVTVIAVTGGRDYNERATVYSELDMYREQFGFMVVIHGHARGLDTLADDWCLERGVQPARCPALWEYWQKRGRVKVAGAKRNKAMALLEPDRLLAFPGGTGTQNMIEHCEAAGILVIPCGGRQ